MLSYLFIASVSLRKTDSGKHRINYLGRETNPVALSASRSTFGKAMYKSNKSDETISFPALQSWNPTRKIATIAAQLHGGRILCRISQTDLNKKFHCASIDPMTVIKQNRNTIEVAARKKIEEQAFEEDGSINILYKDL